MDDTQINKVKSLLEQGRGYTFIAKSLGISVNTIKSFCRRQRLKKNRIALAERTFCENCGREILQIAKQKPKRFCCDKCRNQWWNGHLDQVKRNAYYPKSCPYCKKKFQAYGVKRRKFCSVECYKKFRLQQARGYKIYKEEMRKKKKYKYIQDWQIIDKQKLSCKWLRVIDKLDHEMHLNEHYQNEIRDARFERMLISYDKNPDEKYAINPWDRIFDRKDCVETILFPEQEPENPIVAKVRRFIEEECSEDEKDFIYKYFGQRMKLIEISKLKTGKNGKPPTLAALSKRKRRILDKVANLLGVKR